MLSPSIITRLEHQHTTVHELIDGLSVEDLHLESIPGKWSIFQNIAHLSSYQHTFKTRIKRILEEHSPSFERYVAESDLLFAAHGSLPIGKVLADLEAERKNLNVLLLGLSDQQLYLKALHPAYGNLTAVDWTEFFLLHEAHHLFTIFKLRAGSRG